MESSLDRFARTRGTALLGAGSLNRQWNIQTGVGAGLLGLTGVIALIAAATHMEVLYGATGPAIAGTINLSLGLFFRQKALRNGPGIGLSEEADALLQALVVRAQVWQGGFSMGGPWRMNTVPRSRRVYGTGQGLAPWANRHAPAQPPASAMDALERGASAYNRVDDALGDGRDERAVRLRNAADAGMAEALHQAATQTEDSRAIEGTVARMEELADLVENALGRPEAASALRTNLEATIEELRAEADAVRELRG